MAEFRNFGKIPMFKTPQDEVRSKRDFRLFSLIMVAICIWGNLGQGREKIQGAPYAHVVNATLF